MRGQERATQFLTGLTSGSQGLTQELLKMFTGTAQLGITGGQDQHLHISPGHTVGIWHLFAEQSIQSFSDVTLHNPGNPSLVSMAHTTSTSLLYPVSSSFTLPLNPPCHSWGKM